MATWRAHILTSPVPGRPLPGGARPVDFPVEVLSAQAGQGSRLVVLPLLPGDDGMEILRHLGECGIPFLAKEREQADPLVLLWPAYGVNPEPWGGVADVVAAGARGPSAVRRLAGTWDGESRGEAMACLRGMEGVYLPGDYRVRYGDGTVAAVEPLVSGAQVPVRGFTVCPDLVRGAGFSPPPGAEQMGDLATRGTRWVGFFPGITPDPLHAIFGTPLRPEAAVELHEAARVAGLLGLRLQCWIGLPGPDGEEAERIVSWVKRFRHLARRAVGGEGKLLPITVDVRCFVPQPWTPFQWMPMAPPGYLRGVCVSLRRELSAVVGCKVVHDLPKWSLISALLARGDRRVGELLLAANRYGGWERVFFEHPLNPSFYVYRFRRVEEPFPWDHLDGGVQREALWEQWQQALPQWRGWSSAGWVEVWE